jgi:aldehyde dehydrogenase (NAD+)
MQEILLGLKTAYQLGQSKSYAIRKQRLKLLRTAILNHETEIYEALYKDLKKNKEEAYVTEIGMVVNEINYALKNLEYWMEPESVGTNLLNLPSSSKIYKEPLGVVLIIGPWNYPFQLCMNPLVGAIAAGNHIVLKPSEFASHTAAVMEKIIYSIFANDYIYVLQGDGATVINNALDNFRFDHIFYTGSTHVGKLIYKKAAEQLTAVTLELGGKSPTVVDETANLEVACKRIASVKFSNCGQMCVAPDYVLVHEAVKEKFIAVLKKTILNFYGEKPEENYNYGKIINETRFNRLIQLLGDSEIIFGGDSNKDLLYIAPTLVVPQSLEALNMQEEIFGPILPILTYKTKEEALSIIAKQPDPLSFYIYSNNAKAIDWWLNNVSFGGGAVNNSAWHLTNHHLPFGGIRNSGIGAYHGLSSFNTFTHRKAVLKTPTWFDPKIRYPNLSGKLKWFKKII